MLPREKAVSPAIDDAPTMHLSPGYRTHDEKGEVAIITIHLPEELQRRSQRRAVGDHGHQHSLGIASALRADREMTPRSDRTYVGVISVYLARRILKKYCVQHRRWRDARSGLPTKRLRIILDYVEGHLHEKIPINRLAQQAYFSAYHFIKLFKASMGETPHKYILRRRMECAKYLLRSSDKSISQITSEVGYKHACNFSSAFKQFTGLSPINYRRSVRSPVVRAGCARDELDLRTTGDAP